MDFDWRQHLGQRQLRHPYHYGRFCGPGDGDCNLYRFARLDGHEFEHGYGERRAAATTSAAASDQGE
jgi:hypothetical protein